MSEIYDAVAARARADAAAALREQGPALLAAIEGSLRDHQLLARLAALEQQTALLASAAALLLPLAIQAAATIPAAVNPVPPPE